MKKDKQEKNTVRVSEEVYTAMKELASQYTIDMPDIKVYANKT